MKKVSFVRSGSAGLFEEAINKFLSKHNVIDIKYQMACPPTGVVYSALIIYEGD